MVARAMFKAWIDAKRVEAEAQDARRKIEDAITNEYGIPEDWEGSKTLHDGGFKIVAKRTMNKKIDGDTLQSVAAQHGLVEHLSVLFRWKPEIDTKKWKDADEEVTRLLAEAITTTPGRISYKIEEEEQE